MLMNTGLARSCALSLLIVVMSAACRTPPDAPVESSGRAPSPTIAAGKGIVTLGIYRLGDTTFALRKSLTPGFSDVNVKFGQAGDIPLAGDWDGNGSTTIGVYRPGDNTFYLRNSNSVGSPD